MRPIRSFLIISGVLLTVTGVSKIISSLGDAPILRNIDPIFSFSFGKIFCLVGTIELVIASMCLFYKRLIVPVTLVVWLATSFVAYRLGLLWVDYRKPCSCMGNLTDALHISPQIADIAMKIILGYLLMGSYFSLFWIWKTKRKTLEADKLRQ
jgi:hypothetical protein